MWALMPICGLTSAVMFIPTLLWVLEQAPAAGRSTVMAAFHTAGSLGFLVGPLVCGELIHDGDFDVAFAVAGLSEILGAVLVVVLALRQGRRAR
jgi:MFS family permease